MSAFLFAALLFAAADPASEPLAPATVHLAVVAPELSPSQRQAVEKAAAASLSELTGFTVDVTEPPSECDPSGCALALARSRGGGFGLLLQASVPSLVLELRGAFADGDSGKLVAKKVRGGNPDEPAAAVKVMLDALLPRWTRLGFSTVVVEAPVDSVVKVDGRRVGLVPLEDVVSLPAGVHDVDVVLPGGEAVLYRPRLTDGARFRVNVDALSATSALAPTEGTAQRAWMRPVSYGLWSAGAVAIAASLVAGGLSRQAGRDLDACGAADRDCLRLNEAQAVEARAQRYAQTGNILLVGGSVLGAAGAGLFVFDLTGGR